MSREVTEIFPLAFVVVGVSAAAWRHFEYVRKKAERQDTAWRAAASDLQGEFVPASGWFSKTPMSISAVAWGRRVIIDHYKVGDGKSSTTFTRVQAAGEGPPDLSLTLREKGILSSIGKALGAQDIALGDGPFDQRFAVTTSDEDLARAWLVPEVTGALFEARPYSHELVAGGQVTSIRRDIENDDHALLRAAKACVLLAGRGAALRAEWRRLAQELHGVVVAEPWADPEPRLEIQERGTAVFIDLVRSESLPKPLRGRLLTSVWGRRPPGRVDHFVAAEKGTLRERDGAMVELEPALWDAIEVRSTGVSATAARFDAEFIDSFAHARPVRVWGNEETVHVAFPGLLFDVARLQSAVKIVARLAAAVGDGPYR
jgi:hypothetical protein